MEQPLPAIAKEIQWLRPDSFSNNKYVIMIGRAGKGGGCHTEMAGRMVERFWVAKCNHNCWKGVEKSFVKACYVARTRHAHHVTAEALYIL